MKFLLIGDVHLRDSPPRMCTETYLLDLLDLLLQIALLTKTRNITAVGIAGDLFDNKIPLKNSHKLMQKIVNVFRQFSCPIYVVAGNHDMCMPASSQALTDKGWRSLKELDGTER